MKKINRIKNLLDAGNLIEGFGFEHDPFSYKWYNITFSHPERKTHCFRDLPNKEGSTGATETVGYLFIEFQLKDNEEIKEMDLLLKHHSELARLNRGVRAKDFVERKNKNQWKQEL